jgi:hypothetical protein
VLTGGVVGSAAGPGGGALVGSGALVAGAAALGAGAVVPTAAVGSAGVGATTSGLPPHEARIGSPITSSIRAARIRTCANGIFTISLLVKLNIRICSICRIVHEIARMLKCARAEATLIGF